MCVLVSGDGDGCLFGGLVWEVYCGKVLMRKYKVFVKVYMNGSNL